MNIQKFPSQTGILKWSGAEQPDTRKDEVIVVKKVKEELSQDARKRYPIDLYYYFKRGSDRWMELIMVCSKNIYEEQ